MADRKSRLFICYAPGDAEDLRVLEKHLKPLQRLGLIESWHTGLLVPGVDRQKQTLQQLDEADIILLLASIDFLDSWECYGEQLRRAWQRHDDGQARLIPIFLRDADYEASEVPFTSLAPLPSNGVPIRRWQHLDQAWTEVARGIRLICEEPRPPASEKDRAGPGPEPTPGPGPEARRRTDEQQFLQACNPEARPFFKNVFARAARDGHVIQFGFKGFSQRVQSPDGLVSFFYGFPQNVVELYFAALPLPTEKQNRLREDLFHLELFRDAGFKRAGAKTLRANVHAGNEGRVYDAYEALLKRVAELIESAEPQDDTPR